MQGSINKSSLRRPPPGFAGWDELGVIGGWRRAYALAPARQISLVSDPRDRIPLACLYQRRSPAEPSGARWDAALQSRNNVVDMKENRAVNSMLKAWPFVRFGLSHQFPANYIVHVLGRVAQESTIMSLT